MALVLTEEQEMLRDSAQAFISENAPIAHLRHLRDSRDKLGYSPALWTKFGEMGFSATLVPEAHGGMGLGVTEASTIAEALGRTLAPSPFFSTAVFAARLLAKAGGAHADALLAQIAAAQTIVAVAIDEAPRHRPDHIQTTASKDGNGFRLSGKKTFVVDGPIAQHLIVSARTGNGITLFVVDPKAAGVSIERIEMVDSHNTARVELNNVAIDAERVLGAIDEGGPLLDDALTAARVVLAAELLGLADEVFQRTLAYLKERKQFDRIIGSFQALQHRAATWYIDVELTRALHARAAHAVDHGAPEAAKLACAAKALACTTANLAAREGVQLHGGMGMTDEFDLGLFMKRERTLQELLGDATFHADRVARFNGY